MDHLPYEITTYIAQNLDKKDYYRCLTVNKQWYSVFIRWHYKDVSPSNKTKRVLFLKSLIFYPKCKEMGRYVKRLVVEDLFIKSILTTQSGTNKYLADAFVYCPNIEQLILSRKTYTIKALFDERTQFKRLQYLDFGYTVSFDDLPAIKCFYKFRSSLSRLKISDRRFNADPESANDIVTYLQSFPQLLKLDYENRDFNSMGGPILHNILSHCHQLQEVEYTGPEMYTITRQLITQKHMSLKTLSLRVGRIYLYDFYYIQAMFPCLQQLTIIHRSELSDTDMMCKILLEMKELSRFKCNIDYSVSVSTNKSFWKYVKLESDEHPDRVLKRAQFKINAKSSSDLFIEKKLHTQNNIITQIYSTSWVTNEHDEYLKDMGTCLDELAIQVLYNPLPVSLIDMNNMCPNLSALSLSNVRFSPEMKCSNPNHKMKKVALDKIVYPNATFRKIESAYPLVEEFRLSEINFKRKYTEAGTYIIKLPPLIKKLELQREVFSDIIVIKELDGVFFRSWHIDRATNRMLVSEKDAIESVIKQWSIEWKVCLMTSYTIEDVYVFNK
ncbi:hypothetical protein BDB01DRAFT_807462 [Pilobolus umbonatus]|nr:hypothetical protein BDB01DRAFT_807462 [Pilobolus umbonatus]